MSFGPRTMKALQDLGSQHALDQHPPGLRFNSLMGNCSNWNFSLQVTEGEYLGGSAAGIDVFNAAQIPGAANPGGIIAPVWPNYNNQVSYFVANPAMMLAMRLVCPPDSTDIGFMQSLIKSVRVTTPQAGGYQVANSYPLAQLVALEQFQNQILDDMAQQVLSGWTYFNLSSPGVAPSTFVITMIILTGDPARISDAVPAAPAVYNRFPGAPVLGSGVGGYRGGSQVVPTKR